MRRFLQLSFLFALTSLAARADLLLQPNDRVALCGGGLPDNGAGVYVEEYLLLTQPTTRAIDFRQLGWLQGDLAQKIDSNLAPFKPSVVLLSATGGGDPATHEKSETDLINALKKAGVRLVVIGSAPAVDHFAYLNDGPEKPAAENQNRAALAEIDKQVAAKTGAVYADVFGVTKAELEKAKSMSGDDYVKQIGWADSVQLAVASAYLKALGCDGSIGSVTIDYATSTGDGSAGQKVSPIVDHKFTVESTQFGFWFPGHGVGGQGPFPWPSLDFLPFNQDLNRYTLTVKNLPTPLTKIYWGDQNCDFASDALAKGVDLVRAMPGWNPMAGPAGNIDNGVRGQQETDRVLGDAVNKGQPDPQADAKHAAALKVVHDRIVPSSVKFAIQPLTPVTKWPPGKPNVILDTDLDGDVDDVGALALLNDFMDQGECTLVAVVHNTINSTHSSCGAIKAIDDWYGHPDIPIGQYLGEHPMTAITSKVDPAPAGQGAYHDPPMSSGSSYTPQVRQRFEPHFPDDEKMPAGVDVYRKALAGAPDGSVVVCTVGLMHNIQDLMLSGPDSVSPLSGMDLIKKKVRLMTNMANTQPVDLYVLSHWPTPIIWTTDVGNGISTGSSLAPTPENNPVRMCYDLFGVLHSGRQSWDLTAAWLAVRGPEPLWDIIAGRPQYISDITKSPPGEHPNESCVTVKMPYPEVTKVIGDELARPPKK